MSRRYVPASPPGTTRGTQKETISTGLSQPPTEKVASASPLGTLEHPDSEPSNTSLLNLSTPHRHLSFCRRGERPSSRPAAAPCFLHDGQPCGPLSGPAYELIFWPAYELLSAPISAPRGPCFALNLPPQRFQQMTWDRFRAWMSLWTESLDNFFLR